MVSVFVIGDCLQTSEMACVQLTTAIKKSKNTYGQTRGIINS